MLGTEDSMLTVIWLQLNLDVYFLQFSMAFAGVSISFGVSYTYTETLLALRRICLVHIVYIVCNERGGFFFSWPKL